MNDEGNNAPVCLALARMEPPLLIRANGTLETVPACGLLLGVAGARAFGGGMFRDDVCLVMARRQ